MNSSINTITASQLLPRRAHSRLAHTPIHVGDVVHLKPACGPDIGAPVIYHAPINGTVAYTPDVVHPPGATGGPGLRVRFRHEHVHRIEPLRRRASRAA